MYGIGAVLAHHMTDGSEKPIGYVSQTLTESEKHYSQLEKEGLACIFAVKKFHSYLFGHKFLMYTDNLSLKSLFNEKQPVPVQAAGRIQRWALILANYEYTMAFRPTHKHSNADTLSRLLTENVEVEEPVPTEFVKLMEAMDTMPIMTETVKEWTQKDPLLARVYRYVQFGWPEHCSVDLKSFSKHKLELSTLNGCIIYGSRVLIPSQGRQQMLAELHQAHPGVNQMKSLARMYFWWPGLTKDIEKLVKECAKCQENQSNPAMAPLEPWTWPTRSWARVHVDYAGPFMNSMFFYSDRCTLQVGRDHENVVYNLYSNYSNVMNNVCSLWVASYSSIR